MLRDQLVPADDSNNTNAPSWDININYVPVTYDDGYPPAIIQMKPDESQVRTSLLYNLYFRTASFLTADAWSDLRL